MRVFDLIHLLDPQVFPENTKVHLASKDGDEDPLRLHHSGEFEEWQTRQTRRNFERDYVLSLIMLPEKDRWLYAGTFLVGSVFENPGVPEPYTYGLRRLECCDELVGRLVVSYTRSGRQPYIYGETGAAKMVVHEIRAESMHLGDFPGFKQVDLPFPDLEVIVRQNVTSWRTALSNVSGIYLISDVQGGKLYVGSATGGRGIWGRWCDYADGHGNNLALKELVSADGVARASAFRLSILEVADLDASPMDVLERESHWKRVLLTRQHGYNRN